MLYFERHQRREALDEVEAVVSKAAFAPRHVA
jgi:hypothetical protein